MTKKVIKISKISIKEIGESLKEAGKLKTSPLAIYGSEKIPENGEPMRSLDRCVAKAILATAIADKAPHIYISKDTLRGCCPGAMTYTGFTKPAKYIKYFVSTGHKNFRGGEAEYLKESPETVEGFLESIGEITPPGKYLVIGKSEDLKDNTDVRSFLCFGNGEQIRNLANLIHFRTKNPFNAINMPFGPACSTFITYPSGMAEKAPKNTAFVGPVDPTGNIWFPPEYMAIGIPLDTAIKMHEDLDRSFISKRPQVAYPKIREKINID